MHPSKTRDDAAPGEVRAGRRQCATIARAGLPDALRHGSPPQGVTGVDPFLDHGIPVANLGTGYFAPESEKEITSLQMMADHALWLVALVQVLGTELPPAGNPPTIRP